MLDGDTGLDRAGRPMVTEGVLGLVLGLGLGLAQGSDLVLVVVAAAVVVAEAAAVDITVAPVVEDKRAIHP